MKTVLFIMVGLVATLNSFAASKNDIWELLQKIDNEVRYYEQNPEVLASTKLHLEAALAALRGRPVPAPRPNECVDFAFNEYRKDNFSNAQSLERAKSFCQVVTKDKIDMEVVHFVYDVLRADNYSASSSFDQTLTLGAAISYRQLGCVRDTFERYRQDGYSGRTSLEKSISFCRS